MSQLTPEQMFDTLAININGPRAWDLDLTIDVTFVDVATDYRLTLRNGVLVHRKLADRASEATRDNPDPATATATVTFATKLRLLAFAAGDRESPGVEFTGDAEALPTLLGVLDRPDPGFAIITP
jgi:alkyl sulfatase BDS1-like metallo-beta-lactamase superfamily hydrolase